ncbi:hypothetical protein MTP03_15910 [Tsukamurella sp. PLM1]|nr:hypothetical protein MTP03_15910 [Tsukamurella sp. PLM1]
MGADEIEAEILRDPTAAGERLGAAALAARPDVRVKEEAWEKVFGDDSLSNTLTRAIAAGIVAPGQGELLAPFTARYFGAIDEVWARRSSEVAQTVVVGLYPSWDISDEAVAAADAWLAGDNPPALRRLVLEGRAGIVRSLAARAFDRA